MHSFMINIWKSSLRAAEREGGRQGNHDGQGFLCLGRYSIKVGAKVGVLTCSQPLQLFTAATPEPSGPLPLGERLGSNERSACPHASDGSMNFLPLVATPHQDCSFFRQNSCKCKCYYFTNTIAVCSYGGTNRCCTISLNHTYL